MRPRGVTRLGGVELPGEAGTTGTDLIEELVVLKRLGTCDFLDCGLNRLFNHRGGFGQSLG